MFPVCVCVHTYLQAKAQYVWQHAKEYTAVHGTMYGWSAVSYIMVRQQALPRLVTHLERVKF